MDTNPRTLARDDWQRFRVANMDCAVEESEIRRAVAGVAGIRAMNIQLGPRTLAIDAPVAAVEQAVAAIRKAGYDPQPLPASAAAGATAAGATCSHCATDAVHDDRGLHGRRVLRPGQHGVHPVGRGPGRRERPRVQA